MKSDKMIEILKEFEAKRVEQLPENAQKLFYAIMKIADERDLYKIKYNKVLEVLSKEYMPCEIDKFMDENSDYCETHCGVDEEQFKKCWDKFFIWKLGKGD